MKEGGYVFIADFGYVNMPKEDFFYGMYTRQVNEGTPPGDFEPFKFIIDKAPDHDFEIFNIGAHLMFKAGLAAGLNQIEFKAQYPDPEVKDDPVVKRYLETCNPHDYLLKFRKVKY